MDELGLIYDSDKLELGVKIRVLKCIGFKCDELVM